MAAEAESPQTVLVVGAGGREHALAWKLSKSPIVQRIFVCPGNGGTSQLPKTVNVNIPFGQTFSQLVQFAVEHDVSDQPALVLDLSLRVR